MPHSDIPRMSEVVENAVAIRDAVAKGYEINIGVYRRLARINAELSSIRKVAEEDMAQKKDLGKSTVIDDMDRVVNDKDSESSIRIEGIPDKPYSDRV